MLKHLERSGDSEAFRQMTRLAGLLGLGRGMNERYLPGLCTVIRKAGNTPSMLQRAAQRACRSAKKIKPRKENKVLQTCWGFPIALGSRCVKLRVRRCLCGWGRGPGVPVGQGFFFWGGAASYPIRGVELWWVTNSRDPP